MPTFTCTFYPVFLTALLLSAKIFAQNAAPVIANIQAFPDETNNRITLTFDVTDAENDPLEIELRVSDNNGYSYLVDVSAVWGDVGYPITPGAGKQITWAYNPTTTNSGVYFLKVIADDRQTPDIQAIVDQVSPDNLASMLSFVQGVRHYTANPTHIAAVKDTLEARFTNAGLQTSRQDFAVGALSGQNIIGRQQGQGDETATVIIDAHFDSVANAPGADDNGSGVVGVLEALRVLGNYQFRHNIKYIGFDLEENGLIGSSYFVNNGGIEPFETLKGVLNFEMIGYYSNAPNSQSVPVGFNLLFADAYSQLVADEFRGNFLINVANTGSNPLRAAFDSCAALYVPALKVISLSVPGAGTIAPDLRRSDHAKFWDAGHKALMLTDGANFRNIHYHTPNDVIDVLDFDFMANNVKATVATAAHLAGIRHCTTALTAASITTAIQPTATQLTGSFTLHPNPASNSAAITLPHNLPVAQPLQLQIFDAKGKPVSTQQLAANPGATATFRTDMLPNGVYMVLLTNAQFKAVQKLVVNR